MSFEKAPDDIRSDGITVPSARPCPDGNLIDAMRQMDLERWSSLHSDSKVAIARACCSPNFMCTVLPSFEGRLRHLEKYDRSDPPPPANVRDFFALIFSAFPRGAPDVEYLEAIDETSHVEAFRERWAHVLHKSAGIDGEKLCGDSATKAEFLDEEGAEQVLCHAMYSAKLGCFVPEMMRAAGRAKVMSQEAFIAIVNQWLAERRYAVALEEFSDDGSDVEPVPPPDLGGSVKTMDRLIWISPPTSLHASTPGARTMARGVQESQVSTYGISPFRGGAQRMFKKFGYLGSYQPIHMQKVLSCIEGEERAAYSRALDRDRNYHASFLFGMGSDVSRMDSSMRRWWIKIWGQNAYQDFPMDETEKANRSQALIDAHCGGKLAMDGKLVATVEEGATTGAIGVSNLESAYRWISDLLGVTFNLQREIVSQLRRTSLKGGQVDKRTADLAGRNHGLSWLYSRRVGVHPTCRKCQLSGEEIRRRENQHALSLTVSDPNYALLPPLGPGTPLFEELLPIVAFYYCTLANGDDDWNTFPLLEYIRLEELPSILDPSARLRWLNSPPKVRKTPLTIISNERMEEAAMMLGLPTKLNPEKGVEGRGLETFLLNSMHPVWSSYDKAYSFYIESSCLTNGLVGMTHPDDVIRSPAHTILRLVGLVFNHPDPRVYETYKAIVEELAEQHDLYTPSGLLNVNDHLLREKNNSLYGIMGPGTAGSQIATDLREGRVRFPDYHEVLDHHNFSRSAAFIREHEGDYTVAELLSMGFPQENI